MLISTIYSKHFLHKEFFIYSIKALAKFMGKETAHLQYLIFQSFNIKPAIFYISINNRFENRGKFTERLLEYL